MAIDCTGIPYYGYPTDQGVVGGKPKKNTKWFFRSATICIVEKELCIVEKELWFLSV